MEWSQGTQSGKWCGSAGKQATHLSFRLVWTAPEPMKFTRVVGGWHREDVRWKSAGSAMDLGGTGSREWDTSAGKQVTRLLL